MKHEDIFKNISEKITDIFGLSFQANRYNDLERYLVAAANKLNIANTIPEIHDWIVKSNLTSIELKTLSCHLTIGESYFFREKTALDLLVQKIIPDLIHQRHGSNKHIRLWSAGCSTGEEPYTLAIIIKEHFPELSDWDITILATDINHESLQKAMHGEYTEWSFRDTDEKIKHKYFVPSDKRWSISHDIKKMVTFAPLNLSEDCYPSSLTNTENMDVIFCRNVMMYFTPDVIKQVSNRFRNSLVDNGWLITSQVELNDEYFHIFERVHYERGLFYRKTDKTKEAVRPQPTKLNNETAISKPKKVIEQKVDPKKEIKKEKKIIVAAEKPMPKVDVDALDAFYNSGQYKHCIEVCLDLIDEGELNPQIFSLLVKSFANLGQHSEGHDIIRDILSKYHATVEMYYDFACFLNEYHDIHHTEEALKKAIYLDHKHVLSHLMLEDLYVKKNNYHSASRHFGIVMSLLNEYADNDIVSGSEGMTANRIKELAQSVINNM